MRGLVTSVGTTIGGLNTPGGAVGNAIGGAGAAGWGITGGGAGGIIGERSKIGSSNMGPSNGTSNAACARAAGCESEMAKIITAALARNQLTCCLVVRCP